MSLASAAMTAATTETCACPEALIPADHCLMIGRCTLALMLSSRFLGDMMFVPEEQRWVGRKKGWKKLRGGGGGKGNATLWLGTRSSLSLQHTGTIDFGASLCILCLGLYYFLSYPHLLTPLLLPCLTPAPHMRSFFSVPPPNCNLCCSSSVSRRDKLKEDSHMALSHLSRGPHESQ